MKLKVIKFAEEVMLDWGIPLSQEVLLITDTPITGPKLPSQAFAFLILRL